MRFRAVPRGLGTFAMLALVAIAPHARSAAAAPPARAGAPATRPGGPAMNAHVTASGTPIRAYINGVPDTGQFLPDTVTLARVNDRRITVRDYVQNYFNSYAEDRPGQDSLGRVTFLQTMINKEVLGRTALSAGYAPTYEDRIKMREHTERVLANTLFMRAILDSADVTEADIQRVYDQYKYEQHFRHILFADPATAERVRRDLISGRIGWKDAVKKYSQAKHDKGTDGDMGWIPRGALIYPIAEQVYHLKPNEISSVFEDQEGAQLVQAVERKTVTPRLMSSLRSTIVGQLRNARAAELSDRLLAIIGGQIGFAIDSANVDWAYRQFPSPIESRPENGGVNLVIDASVPEFSPTDTSRVLGRWKGGQLTVGGFMQAFSDIPPIVRPACNTFDGLAGQVANVVLEPYRAKIALERGYDKDPQAMAQIEMKREQILVEHMYEDSVASRVSITPAERRRYYERNKASFVTFASRRFATILRNSQAGVDSLIAALKSGRRAEDVIAADSAAGFVSGTIHELNETEHGVFKELVFGR